MAIHQDKRSNGTTDNKRPTDTDVANEGWLAKHWQPLVDQYPQWAARLGTEAQYILPTPVIDALERIPPLRREARAILSAADANAERAFAAACAAYGPATIGVWGGTPLHYPLLEGYHEGRRSLDPSEADDPESARMATRRVAYTGWLAFSAEFRAETEKLRAQWAEVFERESNVGPFVRHAPAIQEVTDKALRQYYIEFAAMCERWQVSDLLTWDVPSPIPPQRGVSIGTLSATLSVELQVDFRPGYLGASSMRATITESLSPSACSHRLPADVVAAYRALRKQNGKPSQYETALHMWLVELAVRRRYGAPRGLAARLVEAFAEMFELSAERIKRIRRLYLACLPTVRHAHEAAKTGAR